MSGQVRESRLSYGVECKESYTYKDYSRLPEGAPFQLIGGNDYDTGAGKKTSPYSEKLIYMF